MKRTWLAAGLMVALGQAAAQTAKIACAIPPVVATAHDQFGRDASFGAHVTWKRIGASPTSLLRKQPGWMAGVGGGSINVTGIDLYAVTVGRHWYITENRTNVPVATGQCGIIHPTPVSVILRLKPGVPRLRSVTLQTRQDYTQYVSPGRPQWARLAAVVDANPGVNTTVVWTSSDPAMATVDGHGYVQAALCHPAPAPVTITATARAGARVSGQVRLKFGRSSARCLTS